MPIVIKSAAMRYRTANGQYKGVDALADATTSEQIAAVQAAGAEQVAAITAMETGGIEVAGTTPSITAQAGRRYVCTAAAVAELTLVVPDSGVIAVRFASGTTATLLTVTPPAGKTLQWPGWFNPDSLEAGAVYEISIEDGQFGGVGVWI